MVEKYQVLVQGHFSSKQVEVIVKNNLIELDEKEQQVLSDCWNKSKSDAIAQNVVLFNGNLINLISFKHDEKLKLFVGKTRYMYYVVGRNLPNSKLKEKINLLYPVSVSAIIKTIDNKIILAERSAKSLMSKNKIHLIPAGHPEILINNSTSVDLFNEITRELYEELNIEKKQIYKIEILGILQDLEINKFEIVFSIESLLSSTEINTVFALAKDSWEHNKLYFVDLTNKAINDFINANPLLEITKSALKLFLSQN